MIKKIIGKLHTRNKGYTLVELLVSMTLTAIFATAVVAVMPAATKIYMQIQDMSRAQVVAVLVIDALREECADTYIEDFASVRIISLSDLEIELSSGDEKLTGTFTAADAPTTRFDSTGNILIIRKSGGYCQAIYSCLPISAANYTDIQKSDQAEKTYVYSNGISSRAVYRFFPEGAAKPSTPDTLQGYVHYGYYQCGRGTLKNVLDESNVARNIDCIYPGVRYDYTNPFSVGAYNGYTVSLEFSDLVTSSSNLYSQRPLSVTVTVYVYKCDFSGQASNAPVYSRSAVLVFAEDTTK